MDAFHQRLINRAATLDEILSNDFEAVPGQKGDADLAARRLAAWCRACAGGDWSLFGRRLQRDGLSIPDVLAKFGTVRRRALAPAPAWIQDAIWIEEELKHIGPTSTFTHAKPCAFEDLFIPVVEKAAALLWAGLEKALLDALSTSVRESLRYRLLEQLSDLCAAALYERFSDARKANAQRRGCSSLYDEFVAGMRAGGFRRLFEDTPIILRLMSSLTRQWLDTSRELLQRLHQDLPMLRREMALAEPGVPIAQIESDLSDPHNCGRSVHIIRFADGSGVVYKPKDLRLDLAWHDLVNRLNRDAPIVLKPARVIPCDGYGWVELIAHAECFDANDLKSYFRRAGAWLALFHAFAALDMHHENIIAAADHPVPIDLEMLLQATPKQNASGEVETLAIESAMETIRNTVMMVGLLPTYFRSPENDIFWVGGLAGDWVSGRKIEWDDINSDRMRPTRPRASRKTSSNLPHIGGRYPSFGDHRDDLIAGFEGYAKFLGDSAPLLERSLDAFAGLPTRKVLRPTRFYYMLMRRLRNHRVMDDGIVWSAQADFLARLTDWEVDRDPLWPLQRAERDALLAFNIPHFAVQSDQCEIRDARGISATMEAISGIDLARARLRSLDAANITRQSEVIRLNTCSPSASAGLAERAPEAHASADEHPGIPTRDRLVAEVDRFAAEIVGNSIRKGPSAAWIGLDWLGDSDFAQLTSLGPDLYNGVSGIALFLAAHAAVTGCEPSREVALAAIAHLRKGVKGRNARRFARLVGTGGAMGLGSVVYAFTVMAKCLGDPDLLADAHRAAALFDNDLVAADKQLDILGGSAGAILALLRLFRDSGSQEVLNHATRCGEHLLAQRRHGEEGRRTWIVPGSGSRPLNGMSHGAAGFAYALASLAVQTGRDDFHQAALECIAFENANYDASRRNWPTWRSDGEIRWTCQWCHGAPGIGLARIGMQRRTAAPLASLAADIENAVEGVRRCWPGELDTLCCGTLGAVEFLCEAADATGQDRFRELALARLTAVMRGAAARGDYRWNTAGRRYNLGLFRGLAGAGYTFLRRLDASLPNVLLWE